MASAARTRRTLKKGRNLFLRSLAECGNVGESCKAASVARSTVYEWRQKDEKFRAEWDTALDAAGDVLEAECRRRAVDGVVEPIMHQGQVVTTVRRFSDTLLIFLLKGVRPRKYNPDGYARLAAHDQMTAEVRDAFLWAKDFRAAEQLLDTRPAQIADQLSVDRLKGGALNISGGH